MSLDFIKSERDRDNMLMFYDFYVVLKVKTNVK